MSRRDEERREETKAIAIERGKQKLRFGQLVLTAFVEDEPVRETAKRLGCSPSTVTLMRAVLELDTGRNWRRGQTGYSGGKRTGRLHTRRDIDELGGSHG